MKKINPQFVIKETKDYQFHFTLKARNGRTILTSETYQTRAGAENGIISVIENSEPENFEIKKSNDNKHYFILKAANNQIIGLSETYNSKSSCKKGIQSVIVNTGVIQWDV
tara:strand:- start:1790 stop:2122 length:333 start_codon:yes stop_codon:yes gene_type:complete